MTAGQEGGTRHRIAQALRREAAHRRIAIELQAMAGSEAALQAVDSGWVDAALIQGGLDMIDHPGLRQVAVLHVEPLHLLVKEEIYRAVARNLAGLRGKVVNLGERGSGTYLLATEVMAFSGLRSEIDYTESTHSYADLERETDGSRLPDAVFSVSTLPSPIARHLVSTHHYRLMSLPFREAFVLGALDHYHDAPPPGRSSDPHRPPARLRRHDPGLRLRDRARGPAGGDPYARHPIAAGRPQRYADNHDPTPAGSGLQFPVLPGSPATARCQAARVRRRNCPGTTARSSTSAATLP